MKRRWMQFHASVVIVVIFVLHIAAESFAFFHAYPPFSHTLARLATKPSSNAQFSTQNQTEILSSYLFNLQKSRRHVQNTHDNKPQLLRSAKSFAFFLSSTYQMTHDKDPLFDRTVIQAIRLAASLNDYRLILQMIQQLVDRAQDAGVSLHPRILGEAVRGLTASSASVAKIRTVWNLSQSDCWKPSVGPLEVNAMLEAMCLRGKIKVALDLYHEAFLGNHTDVYSLSILFKGLASSIQDKSHAETEESLESFWINTNTTTSLMPLGSVCWQWNQALLLFESSLSYEERKLVSNPTIATLLEINQRANQVYGRVHDGAAKSALLFEWLQSRGIPLDVITCTVILSQLQNEWKTALHILRTMNETIVDEPTGLLPEPNARVYSACMAVCARAGRYEETLQLLEEIKSNPRLNCDLNTVMYNSVLQAMVKNAFQSKSAQRKQRLMDMFDIFNQMNSSRQEGSHSVPDTVTYNTMLSGISVSATSVNVDVWKYAEVEGLDFDTTESCGVQRIVHQLLKKMEIEGVARDERTYVHSLQAIARSSNLHLEDLLSLVRLSFSDVGHNPRVYNAALAATISLKSSPLQATQEILAKIMQAGIYVDGDTTTILVDALCAANETKSVAFLFEALLGDEDSQRALVERTGLLIFSSRARTPEVTLYVKAISKCLLVGEYGTAKKLHEQVRSRNLPLEAKTLEKIAQSYALSAIATERKTNHRTKKNGFFEASLSRAESAFSLLENVDEPELESLALVSKACVATGRFDQSQICLRQSHIQFLKSISSHPTVYANSSSYLPMHRRDRKIIQNMHSSLMRYCAKTGSISLALRLCEDIQSLAAQIAWLESPNNSSPFPKAIPGLSETTSQLEEVLPVSRDYLGMNLREWKWLIQAAAKAGHWKVCLSAFQMLRPYVEFYHKDDSSWLGHEKQFDPLPAKDYNILCNALGITISCLCENHQPAWVVRSIDDWILWSGHKPPHEAVIKAVRLLSSKGQHNSVASLLSKSISAGLEEDPTYEIRLVVGAISTLYKDGHSVAADDIFLLAVTNGWIPFDLKRQDVAGGALVLDLHGMNLPMAHSAVRIAFQQGLLTDTGPNDDESVNDLVIVTGRGRNSALKMRPILRPAVQRMLVEEFYPPIGTTSIPGNMGALRICSEDIRAWLQFQRQQKGARMIEVATALKKLSSGSALKAILRSAQSTDINRRDS
ncbi:hypothetical protein FisN_2Lh576 [Fistulifera solaris]|uniref:Smr domain-containing protein n=1 Tax=Fistulifera solaris TaxID=1519565 RepID=A0A1Z5K940_FISSO|nr:hypothetical protein FisN_2Lh576 [Fistulifera solaris]|eukprot:GAX22747.1 hypothetical protein FisN_2Lh576 [Fistulifera solaris]